ncbi:MAG: hypothetical protein V4622_00065 [Bacteroidota bacterium]
MKYLKILVLGCAFLFTFNSNAQVQVNVNIGTAPNWGPSGYSDVQYYYLPDIEAYYDIHTSMFIYMNNGIWIRRSYLPSRCRNYDLYGGYKVVLNDYHGHKPYGHFKDHKHKYAKGYKGKSQKNIGMKPGNGNGNHKSPQKIHVKQKSSPVKMKGNGNHGGGHGGGNKGGGNHGGGHGGGKGKH